MKDLPSHILRPEPPNPVSYADVAIAYGILMIAFGVLVVAGSSF